MEKSLLLRTIGLTSVRYISTTAVNNGKKNFRQLALYNFRGTRRFKKFREEVNDPDIPIYTYGVREPGFTRNKKFHLIPEMIPELIVPDLTECKLKPYVSYRASEVIQSEFTAKDLFDAMYSEKIREDFKAGKLDENGNPKEPNFYEKLTAEEARIEARKTGSDIY